MSDYCTNEFQNLELFRRVTSMLVVILKSQLRSQHARQIRENMRKRKFEKSLKNAKTLLKTVQTLGRYFFIFFYFFSCKKKRVRSLRSAGAPGRAARPRRPRTRRAHPRARGPRARLAHGALAEWGSTGSPQSAFSRKASYTAPPRVS